MFEKWEDPESVLAILGEISAGQPCDISGISSYQMLDDHGGIQWPLGKGHQPTHNQRRLFEDGRFYHENGKAKLIFADRTAMPEPPSDAFPFLLLTGRGTASQWHTQTRTGKSSVLKRLYPQDAYVEINPADAKRLSVLPQQWVTISSQRARITARAFITPTVKTGHLFMPMHYNEVNQLTLAHFDPYSRQPSYKNCAVNLESTAT